MRRNNHSSWKKNKKAWTTVVDGDKPCFAVALDRFVVSIGGIGGICRQAVVDLAEQVLCQYQ
tara:strand:+ start:56 stop:241 length:186 start_codon:yes stop_codon:yes gene_type:complete